MLATCAMDPNMQFVSNGSKHKSWLLNKLFTVKPISGYSGFPRNTFSPPFPLSKSFSYEKKFNSVIFFFFLYTVFFIFAIVFRATKMLLMFSFLLFLFNTWVRCRQDESLIKFVKFLLNFVKYSSFIWHRINIRYLYGIVFRI